MESANSEVATFTGITIEEVETYLRMYEEFEAVGGELPMVHYWHGPSGT